MTEVGTTPRGLLATIASSLPDTETPMDVYEGVCEAAVDAGYEYARFDSTDASIECVERGTSRDESRQTDLRIANDTDDYGTLTLEPSVEPVVDRETLVDILVFALERVEAASRRQTLLEDQARKVQKLHSIAARMAECTAELDIFHLGMDAAENILELDVSSLDVVEDGMIVPRVLSTGMPDEDALRLEADEGIAGETYQETRTIIVDDLREHPKGNPENPEFRSLLSVPIEGHGVFQAGAREVGAFDETDAELAELLMTHVSQSLDRLDSAAQLRESEEKYRTLVEQSHDAVAIYQEGSLVFANARAEDLVGREADELQGTGPAELVHEADAETVESVAHELYTSEADHTTYDVRVLAADGDHRHCECSASRIRYRGDDAVLVSVRDITDRKRRQQELERQNERLEEFASVVSHDLRNPLNVVRGSLDLAERTGEERHYERADEALDRMEDLIEGVLDLARQGKLVDDTERVDLAAVVQRAWQSVESSDACIDVDVADVAVEADPMRLQELFENLFRNSVEHGCRETERLADGGDDAHDASGVAEADGQADADGQTDADDQADADEQTDAEDAANVSVTVSALTDENGFAIADDGPGIPADRRADVFDRGYSSKADGTGFGLAIVESIAEAHGWSIELAPADGARFEVTGVSMF